VGTLRFATARYQDAVQRTLDRQPLAFDRARRGRAVRKPPNQRRLRDLTGQSCQPSLTLVLLQERLMETTKLSSKGQVIIPKALRSAHRWEAGLELMVIDTGDGLLLKPKAPFAPSELSEVFGMFKGRVAARTDEQIKAALLQDMRRKWRDSD
jgi:AbrB family looped-hinge helix DNA binding protein